MEDYFMKKLFVLFLFLGYCLNGIANKPTGGWVVTNASKMDVKRVNFGITKARIVLKSGEKKAIPIDQLSSYSIDGKVFDKLPLYKNGKPTGRTVFMELVRSRGDYSLYKYSYLDIDLIPQNEKVDRAFVFNGDKLQLEVDEKSLPNICNFFGLKGAIE
jgi:hypothetical protein